MSLTLAAAQTIVSAALAHGREKGMKPLAVLVFDARGALKAAAVEDNNAWKRAEIATGKALGALGMGVNSRALGKIAEDRPHFTAALAHVFDGRLVPVAGGVIVKEGAEIVGAVGVSGDTSDNDEAAAMAGIAAAGLAGG
ncbi:MAG TPA: heme-binding protein [Hyphomicrobiales bacterium]|nr:heme-binding protein [Hyphomicrobiales bacterium]